MRWFFLAACLFLHPGLINGQETPPAEADDRTPAAERSLSSLQTIAEPLSASLADLANLRDALEQAATEDAKEEIQIRIDSERERISQLRENFRSILGGSEAAEYEESNIESASIQDQITELVQPVLSEIREATSEPRELDALRKSLAAAKERKRKTDIVLSRIEDLIGETDDPAVVSELNSARRLWASRQAEATSQIAVYSVQIDDRMQDKRSLWEKLSSGFSSFFKSRGMNLLYALLAAVAGYFITRKAYRWISHVSPVHRTEKNNFTRISDVLAMTVSIVVAIAGIIIVFYVRGDWLLLTLVVIFLIGVAWAGKTAIPPYLEQIRMILNLGSVREGERVIYEGLPWKVSKLAFYTTFTNPNLMGGLLRIPIRDVMGMISRPVEQKEIWFPSEMDDWVILSDETYGKVIIQSPDQVVVLRLGGATKTYPTADYLSLSPLNLSHGFRITVTFGIDYEHQAECTTTIPEIFQKALMTALFTEYGHDDVRSVKVEFSSASASSLDYEILADFDGSLAQKYNPIQRRIQSVCVDACNENGWGIPFTQITVHQSDS